MHERLHKAPDQTVGPALVVGLPREVAPGQQSQGLAAPTPHLAHHPARQAVVRPHHGADYFQKLFVGTARQRQGLLELQTGRERHRHHRDARIGLGASAIRKRQL
mmetsp:Transcript_111801/g.310750  ORF Transcript_111801/g.310750 Transcript_111801/m.310750 type:complete len:105 (-) Transcript_111801:897-1211(-)